MDETSNPNSSAVEPSAPARKPSPRRALLDLAPLELDCMNTLWPLGEGTVREIRDRLAARRPRAYTTIMTIMDRLARKGVVERRKSGRAYTYRPNLTADEARSQALAQVIENFFAGSKEHLLAHLKGTATIETPSGPAAPSYSESAQLGRISAEEALVLPRARAAAASAASPPSMPAGVSTPAQPPSAASTSAPESDGDERIDDTLL